MANTKVTTGVIKDDAVGADQLASNAVVTASITDNAITTAKINDNAILTAKINDSAITNAKLSANSVDSDQYVDASIDTAHIRDGQITSAKLDTNMAIGGTLTLGSHLIMGNNDNIKLGANAELEIYHDGTSSFIKETDGSGNLKIMGSNIEILDAAGQDMIAANSGSFVRLYYSNALKLETTSGGVTVTGTLTSTGTINALTLGAGGIDGPVSNNFALNTPNSLRINIDSNASNTGESFIIGKDQTAVNQSNILVKVQENGRVAIGNFSDPDADLEVRGTTVISTASDGVNSILMGLSGSNRTTIQLDTADTTHTNRQWGLTNIAGDFYIGRHGLGVMTLLNNGDIGIGVTPTTKLEVQDANGVSIKFGDLASYPNNVVPCFIGTGTSALAGVNGDLVLVPRTSDAGKIILATGHNGAATEKVRITPTEMVINEGSLDYDFRVESNGNTHMLFVDGGNNRVGIGRSSPTSIFEVHIDTNKNIGYSGGQGELGSIPALVAYQDNGSLTDIGFRGTTVRFASTNQERMRIDETGVVANEGSHDADFRIESNDHEYKFFVDAGNNNIGIATSSPVADVHIKQIGDISNGNSQGLMLETGAGSQKYILQCGRAGVSNAYFNLRDVTNTRDIFSVIDTDGKFQGHTPFEWNNAAVFNEGSQDYDFRVESNANTHMLFVDGGNNAVGIGDGTPATEVLLVSKAGNQSESAPHMRIQGAGYSGYHFLDGTAYYIGQNSAARVLRLYSGAESAGVNLAAGGTSFGTFSDERLKENIQDIGSVIEKIKDIRCVTFNRTDIEDAQETIGFIAQDFVGKFDQVLDESKVLDSDEETRYSIKYTETIPVLLKAIQEQQTVIESLTKRIEELEG